MSLCLSSVGLSVFIFQFLHGSRRIGFGIYAVGMTASSEIAKGRIVVPQRIIQRHMVGHTVKELRLRQPLQRNSVFRCQAVDLVILGQCIAVGFDRSLIVLRIARVACVIFSDRIQQVLDRRSIDGQPWRSKLWEIACFPCRLRRVLQRAAMLVQQSRPHIRAAEDCPHIAACVL